MKRIVLVVVAIAMLTCFGCVGRQTFLPPAPPMPPPPSGPPPHGGYAMARTPDDLMIGRHLYTCTLSMLDMSSMSLLEPAKRAGINQDQQAKLKKILNQNEQTKNALIDRAQKLTRQVRAAMLSENFDTKKLDVLLAASSAAEVALVKNDAKVWKDIRTVLSAKQAKAVLDAMLGPMHGPPGMMPPGMRPGRMPGMPDQMHPGPHGMGPGGPGMPPPPPGGPMGMPPGLPPGGSPPGPGPR